MGYNGYTIADQRRDAVLQSISVSLREILVELRKINEKAANVGGFKATDESNAAPAAN